MKPFNVIVRPEEAPKPQPSVDFSDSSKEHMADLANWVHDYVENRLSRCSGDVVSVDYGALPKKIVVKVGSWTATSGYIFLKCYMTFGSGKWEIMYRARAESILNHLLAELEYRIGRSALTPQERGLAVDSRWISRSADTPAIQSPIEYGNEWWTSLPKS